MLSTQKIDDTDWVAILKLPLNGNHRAILEAMKASGDLTIRKCDIVDRYDDTAAAAASISNMFRKLKTKYRIHHQHGHWLEGPFTLVIVEPSKGY